MSQPASFLVVLRPDNVSPPSSPTPSNSSSTRTHRTDTDVSHSIQSTSPNPESLSPCAVADTSSSVSLPAAPSDTASGPLDVGPSVLAELEGLADGCLIIDTDADIDKDAVVNGNADVSDSDSGPFPCDSPSCGAPAAVATSLQLPLSSSSSFSSPTTSLPLPLPSSTSASSSSLSPASSADSNSVGTISNSESGSFAFELKRTFSFLRGGGDDNVVTLDSRERRVLALRREWTADVLPAWSKQMRASRLVQRLVWHGIPSQVRSQAWPAIVGNDLKISLELYEIMRHRAKQTHRVIIENGMASERRGLDHEQINKEHSLRLIASDIPRTFPLLKIFHEDGPLHEPLVEVLQSYVAYRPDIGYVQGMSYLASMFLLNMDAPASFAGLANLLHQDIYYSFFRMEIKSMSYHLLAFQALFSEQLPALYKRFKQLDISPDMYMYEWLLTVFSRSLPLDVAHRIWDNFLYLGPSFLFRTALGLLRLFQPDLLKNPFEDCLMLLNHPPEDINEEALFANIAHIKCSPDKFVALIEKHSISTKNQQL